jgi:hypothetical protein
MTPIILCPGEYLQEVVHRKVTLILLDLGRMMVIALIQDDKKMGKKFGKNL